MEIQYTGRHFQVDDSTKKFAEDKLAKLMKFIDQPQNIHLTLEVEKHRQIAELHIAHRHGVLQATEAAEQMFDAIHAAVEKAEKQARRARKKYNDKKRRAVKGDPDHHWPLDIIEAESFSSVGGPRVIKRTRLPIKPMTIDEAALGLEISKNEFFVFLDSSNDRVSVLYRRNDGHFGLIAPEF